MTSYDREPTSDAERARWRVCDGKGPWTTTMDVVTVDGAPVGSFATPALAAEAVWAHNVLHAAREQRALGVGLHDGCVAREALVQVGWTHPVHDDADDPGLCSGSPEGSRYCWTCGREQPCGEPVYRLRTDEHGQATRGAK